MSLVKQLTHLYCKYSLWILAAFLAMHLFLGIIPGWNGIRSDFPNYYTASTLLSADKDSIQLYNNDWFQDQIYKNNMQVSGKFSPFPPPTAFIMAAFSKFSPLSAKRMWLLLSLGLMILCFFMIQKISGMNKTNSALLLVCPGLALSNELMLGQVYILLLALMLGAYILLNQHRKVIPSLMLGFGIAVKYFPLVFVPGLVITRKWITLLYIILSIIFLNVLAWQIFGGQTYFDFFHTVFFKHLEGKLEGQSVFSPAFQSWNALGAHLFLFNALENPNPVISSSLIYDLFRFGIPLSVSIYSLRILYPLRHRTDFFEYSVILFSVLVLFLTPAGASYHSLLYILPFTLLGKISNDSGSDHSGKWIVLITCLVISGIFPLLQSRFSFFNGGTGFVFYRLWLNSVIFFTVSKWLNDNRSFLKKELQTQELSGK